MRIVCSWCQTHLREKPPLSDPAVSHGICPPCAREVRRSAGISSLGLRPIDFSVPARVEIGDPAAAVPAEAQAAAGAAAVERAARARRLARGDSEGQPAGARAAPWFQRLGAPLAAPDSGAVVHPRGDRP
jgi:hypothetical protein